MIIDITGDVHRWGDIHKLNPSNFPRGKELTKKDVVMIPGDAGFVWNGKSDQRIIDWIDNRPWTTVVIPGNHENYKLLMQYPIVEFHGAKAYKISESLFYILRGEILELDGKSFLCFGGAFSHDIEYRTLDYSWFREELPIQSEIDNCIRNLNRYGNAVDYVITHDVPERINLCLGYEGIKPWDMEVYRDENDVLKYINILSFLQNLYEMVSLRYTWFAGHYHVNRRIMDVQVLYDDIVEIADNDDGYIVLENNYQRIMHRLFTKDELRHRFEKEELFLNMRKVGKYTDFGIMDHMIKGTDYLRKELTQSELNHINDLYNIYTVQKDT